jgi:hypothetical protein
MRDFRTAMAHLLEADGGGLLPEALAANVHLKRE